MTMIERAAQAVEDAGRKFMDDNAWADVWGDVPNEVFARAVIEALREPTDAILKAMRDEVPVDGHEWEYLDSEAPAAWRAMIDAALNG